MRAVERILELMSTQPNARPIPKPGDIEGNFDTWFDGGAVKHDTGITTYRFADGSVATTSEMTFVWHVAIGLPDGRRIRVSEEDAMVDQSQSASRGV